MGTIVPIVMLIGLPGSGKSFLAARAVRDGPARVISTDAIRARLYGDAAIQGHWLQVWAAVAAQWREAAAQIRAGDRSIAIYDATNTARKKRRSTITAMQAAGFTQVMGLFLDLPLALCLERNCCRPRQVPTAVILAMHRQLVGAPPAAIEGFARLERAISSEGAAIALATLLENRTSPEASL
ncbi:MAG: AAA family ATPase [Cyanobacteria bacterium J06641_5]